MKPPPQMLSLLEWLQPRKTEMTRLLREFVLAESPSFDKASVDRFGRIVAGGGKRAGARVPLLHQGERGDHIRAEWNPRGNRAEGQILVLGHLDTVYGL